ncbi:MerR family transcriptional regulator [Nocardiopsis mangrovi]|uniref:MerR family transcriptional regulator n=1 Tax=Nocardiopsis mangrovi TaxID=1179818 RepID=A0ABV9DU33_9ACTN
MRSRELADLAGVTVRTLRHYHQIGLLPEPERSANGYRRYTADDLVRVVRVRHLAEAGVGLADIPRFLGDGPAESNAAALDRVEADIDARIARLQAQRELVRSLRADQRNPRVPVGVPGSLADVHDMSGLTPEAARLDFDIATLVTHLSGAAARPVDEGIAALRAVADLPAFFSALNGLADLPPEAAPEQRRHVAHRLRAHLAVLRPAHGSPLNVPAERLLDELLRRHLNAAQLDALDQAAR